MSSSDQSESQHLAIVYNRFKYKIPLKSTFKELQSDIETLTGVPMAEQKIISKGRRISASNPETKLDLLGVVGNCKAMLIRQGKPLAKEIGSSRPLGAMRSCSLKHEKLCEDILQVKESIDKHVQGFLDESKTLEALNRDRRSLKLIEEACMRLLEELDSISSEESGETTSARAERKSIVARVNSLLRDVDHAKEDINMLEQDRYGDVAARRGKS